MKVGVIGLGAMGQGIAANLANAGVLTLVWNRTVSKAEAFSAQYGIPVADDVADLASQVDVMITSVSADQDLQQVLDLALPHLKPGATVVDTSTVASNTVQVLSERCAALGVNFIDGPVSGGMEGAKNGQLVMMAGGDAALIQTLAETVLHHFCKKVVCVGAVGAGQATKAVNQIMAAGIAEAVTEALAFGQAQGLDMNKVIEVVGNGAAGNWFVLHRGPSMTQGQFTPGFKVALHDKDLAICQQMSESIGVPLPLVETVRDHYRQLIQAGYGEEDISALYRLKRS